MNDYAKKVISTENFIDYQNDSIVSKTIVSANNSSLTLFSFDAGQAIASHSAPVDALVQVIDGKVEITISGEKFNLEKGDMILMPKGEPHGLKAISKFKMALFKV